MAFTSRLKQLLLANNELETIDITSLASHFPKLTRISLHQRQPWLCTDLYRTLAALSAKEIEAVDSSSQLNNCFEPRNAFNELLRTYQRNYATLLLGFLATIVIFLCTVALLTVSMRRSLRRMRADSISKSFEIKMIPHQATQLPLPPSLPTPENIYEENVYNHVYSDPTPTTTL